jgi:hypothetical protein
MVNRVNIVNEINNKEYFLSPLARAGLDCSGALTFVF